MTMILQSNPDSSNLQGKWKVWEIWDPKYSGNNVTMRQIQGEWPLVQLVIKISRYPRVKKSVLFYHFNLLQVIWLIKWNRTHDNIIKKMPKRTLYWPGAVTCVGLKWGENNIPQVTSCSGNLRIAKLQQW